MATQWINVIGTHTVQAVDWNHPQDSGEEGQSWSGSGSGLLEDPGPGCLPDDGFLQLGLRVMDHVLQDPPQGHGDGEEDEDAGDEPGFAVSPDLDRDRILNWVTETAPDPGGLPGPSAAPRRTAEPQPPAGERRGPEPAGGSTSSTPHRYTASWLFPPQARLQATRNQNRIILQLSGQIKARKASPGV